MRIAVFRIREPNDQRLYTISNIEDVVLDNYLKLSKHSEFEKFYCEDIVFVEKEKRRYLPEEYDSFTHFEFQ